jgi:poly-gamma-glutamate synthesis protein (capsule biosynthesis protein)
MLHGGEEWSREPSREIRRIVTELALAGADAVFGSHPHVVQGVEWVQGRPVFWSLGNFVFPGMDGTPGGEEGLLVRAGFLEDRMLYVRALPLSLSAEGVRLADPSRR